MGVGKKQDTPIDGPTLKAKALELAQSFNIKDFSASTNWLDRFKHRHGIKAFFLHGEAADVDILGVRRARSYIPEFMKS